MLKVVCTDRSGLAYYMWPRPRASVSTRKSTYVRRARMGDRSVLVGCGVYLADAPIAAAVAERPTAKELTKLVGDAAAVLERRGEAAYPELRVPGSSWFR